MKTQHRNFVVEIKSRGRRSATQPNSIWGNTDLKAFARKAEADAPQLFEPTVKSEPIVHQDEVAPKTLPQIASNDNANVDYPDPTEALSADPVEFPAEQTAPILSAADTQELPAETQAPKPRKRAKQKSVKMPVPEIRVVSDTAPVMAELDAPADELEFLETENLRLKLQLARHLHQQNIRLRQMLERFATR